MSEQSLKIGIIGAGGIVRQRHAPGLAQIEGVETVAVCNSTTESARRFADDWAPDARVFDSPDALISSECDVVWIGTTPHLHCPLTCAALGAGKHVFCQARMAMSVAEAEQMLTAAADRPELVTALCPPPMGMKADLLMQQLLSEKVIGTPHHLRLQSLAPLYLDPDAPPHWRQRREISGIQVLTLGIYIEVLQRWFGEISSVYAQGRTVNPRRNGYTVQIPDLVDVLCRFESGIEGSLQFSGVAAHAPGDRLEVYGENGAIIYDFATEEVHLGKVSDRCVEPVPLATDLARDWTVERDFIAAIRNPTAPRPRPTFVEGLEYMKVVEAVDISLGEGRVVTL